MPPEGREHGSAVGRPSPAVCRWANALTGLSLHFLLHMGVATVPRSRGPREPRLKFTNASSAFALPAFPHFLLTEL